MLTTEQRITSQPLKNTTKIKGNTKKPICRRIFFFKKFLESRQKTGPKAETRRRQNENRTRQNNKGADRMMESNDSPEIPARGETSEEPGLPSGKKNGRVFLRGF